MRTKCENCSHSWSQHDLFGCAKYQCECLYIDGARVYIGLGLKHYECRCLTCRPHLDPEGEQVKR